MVSFFFVISLFVFLNLICTLVLPRLLCSAEFGKSLRLDEEKRFDSRTRATKLKIKLKSHDTMALCCVDFYLNV